MSLPDGEYEIDLAALLADAPHTLTQTYGNVSADLDLTHTLPLNRNKTGSVSTETHRPNQTLHFQDQQNPTGITPHARETPS